MINEFETSFVGTKLKNDFFIYFIKIKLEVL